MSFNSVIFIFLFCPFSVAAYYIALKINSRAADYVLALFSLAFYGWAFFDYIFLLFAYILVLHMVGKYIEKRDKENGIFTNLGRKWIFIFFIVVAIGLLGYYKYSNFIIGSINSLTGSSFATLNIIVPLGISYITFSSISFLVDVYREDASVNGLVDTFIYILMFPKVACGPILLYKNFKNDFRIDPYNLDNMVAGINRIIVGLAKKVILANYFGTILTNMTLTGMDTVTGIASIFIYSFQLYLDFSGYTDMAIGLGMLFGYKLPENFIKPYSSKSIKEFWRRWHASLGAWFKEYVYIPLGGSRVSKTRNLVNLMIVFAITGIWHGAGVNYIIWGMMHGICTVYDRLVEQNRIYKRIPNFIKWICTFSVVCIGWQFFRYSTVAEFNTLIKDVILFNDNNVTFTWIYYLNAKFIAISIISILCSFSFTDNIIAAVLSRVNNDRLVLLIKQTLLIVLLALGIIATISTTYSPFIYFRY